MTLTLEQRSRRASWEQFYGPVELAQRALPEPVAHVAAYYIACSEIERKLGWHKAARHSEQRAILHFNKARG